MASDRGCLNRVGIDDACRHGHRHRQRDRLGRRAHELPIPAGGAGDQATRDRDRFTVAFFEAMDIETLRRLQDQFPY